MDIIDFNRTCQFSFTHSQITSKLCFSHYQLFLDSSMMPVSLKLLLYVFVTRTIKQDLQTRWCNTTFWEDTHKSTYKSVPKACHQIHRNFLVFRAIRLSHNIKPRKNDVCQTSGPVGAIPHSRMTLIRVPIRVCQRVFMRSTEIFLCSSTEPKQKIWSDIASARTVKKRFLLELFGHKSKLQCKYSMELYWKEFQMKISCIQFRPMEAMFSDNKKRSVHPKDMASIDQIDSSQFGCDS